MATKSGIFSISLMYLEEVVFSYVEPDLNDEDSSNTFVSAKFSRSFV